MTFKDIYRGPFENTDGYSKVFTADGNMAFDFIPSYSKNEDELILSEDYRDIILSIINGQSPNLLAGDFKYENTYIWIRLDRWYKIILIRGWGHLTGTGGLHLPEKEATKIQDNFGNWIAETLNKKLNNY